MRMAKTKKAEKEEARILKARGRFQAELLSWVVSPEQEITQDVDRFLDRVMKDRRRRIEVFLTGLARKYVERAVYFIGRLPDIEEELLSPNRITTMKNSDLIRLLCVLADQVKDASDFLRNFVSDEVLKSEPVPTPGSEFGAGEKGVDVEEVSEDERRAAEELPPESRRRIGGIVMKVVKAIDAANRSKHVDALPAPVNSGKTEVPKRHKDSEEKSKGGS